MLKELPGELNRKLKRMQFSRDNLKECNREKTQQNKRLRDRNVELTENRDKWKSHCRELEEEFKCQREELRLQIESANQAIEQEKIQKDREHKRAELLQAEIEELKKKLKSLNA
jgi:hypothetical protein